MKISTHILKDCHKPLRIYIKILTDLHKNPYGFTEQSLRIYRRITEVIGKEFVANIKDYTKMPAGILLIQDN